MFRRELLMMAVLAGAVFLTVAGLGWFVVLKLNETSKSVVLDTMPGLVQSGLAEESMYDTRHALREVLLPHTADERQTLMEFARTNTADSIWRHYADSIFEPEDQKNYDAMCLVRSNYLATFPSYFDLVRAGKMDQANAYFYGEQNRLFHDYAGCVRKMFAYNAQQGDVRARSILTTIRLAPWTIGLLCLLVFVLGFTLGLRSALNVGK